MSELLTAVQCCCDPLPNFSGLTWFEVRPLVERTKFKRGFQAWGGDPPDRFLALFDYNTIPEDYVFFGSCGQFWILKNPVCSIQDYIDSGGTYVTPGTDPDVFGCGFPYPENLIVQPNSGLPLPYPSEATAGGTNWTDLRPFANPNSPEPRLYGNGNLLTRVWGDTSYFSPGMTSLEGEFLDIRLTQEATGNQYDIRYSPVEKIWQANAGGEGDQPSGKTSNSPYADSWYNMKKYVRDRGSFTFNLEFLGGLKDNAINQIEIVEQIPPCIFCCHVTSSIEFDACSITEDGRWTGSTSGAIALPTPQGGACGLDVDTSSNYGSATLLVRGTQVVQIQGQPTELAVPKNGMGDEPRLLDPFVFKTGFTYFSKSPYPCDEDAPDCYYSEWISGPGGEAFREWRVDPGRLLGSSGGFQPSDSVLAQYAYALSGGQVVQSDPAIIRPTITNSHSPVDGGQLAQIVWGAYDAAFPDQNIFGCGLSSGLVCVPPHNTLDDECQSDQEVDTFDICGFPGFTTSEISVTY